MKKLQKSLSALIIPVTIAFLLIYMLTTDTSQAKHQFKCNIWSAELRDKSQQNMLSNITQFERDDAFGSWFMEKTEYEKECGIFTAYVDTSDASHEEKCDRFMDYRINFTAWAYIMYEQDDALRTIKLLKTQFDEECADYAH